MVGGEGGGRGKDPRHRDPETVRRRSTRKGDTGQRQQNGTGPRANHRTGCEMVGAEGGGCGKDPLHRDPETL